MRVRWIFAAAFLVGIGIGLLPDPPKSPRSLSIAPAPAANWTPVVSQALLPVPVPPAVDAQPARPVVDDRAEKARIYAPRHAELRQLYKRFLGFKDSPLFRLVGFSPAGPYRPWLAEIAYIAEDKGYLRHLAAECDVIPDDLLRLARSYMNGKPDRESAVAWARCFRERPSEGRATAG